MGILLCDVRNVSRKKLLVKRKRDGKGGRKKGVEKKRREV